MQIADPTLIVPHHRRVEVETRFVCPARRPAHGLTVPERSSVSAIEPLDGGVAQSELRSHLAERCGSGCHVRFVPDGPDSWPAEPIVGQDGAVSGILRGPWRPQYIRTCTQCGYSWTLPGFYTKPRSRGMTAHPTNGQSWRLRTASLHPSVRFDGIGQRRPTGRSGQASNMCELQRARPLHATAHLARGEGRRGGLRRLTSPARRHGGWRERAPATELAYVIRAVMITSESGCVRPRRPPVPVRQTW